MPQPRTLPGRNPNPDPFPDLARRLAGLPPESRAAAVEAALREAHRAGLSAAGQPIPDAEQALLADIGAALTEGGDLALVQPLGPCPGMPWQMEVSGQAVLDGAGFAASFSDAAVQGLLARGALAAGPAGGLVAGPRLGALARAEPAAPRP